MSAGKGDIPRKVDGDKFRAEMDRIFRARFKPGMTVKIVSDNHTGTITGRNGTTSDPLAPRWFVDIEGDEISFYESEMEPI
jgi:hypothetical protein